MKKYDKKVKSPNKSIWTVLISLIIIFILLLGGIFYLKYKTNIDLNKISMKKISLDDTIKKQLENQAGEKTVQVRVTEDDLTKILNTDDANFPLKNPTVKIVPEKIILAGKTGNSPLSFKVEVGIIPRVEAGKVKFDIKEIKTAGVSAPKVVTDSVNQKLSNYLKQFSPREDMTVTEVKLNNGYLIITGERK